MSVHPCGPTSRKSLSKGRHSRATTLPGTPHAPIALTRVLPQPDCISVAARPCHRGPARFMQLSRFWRAVACVEVTGGIFAAVVSTVAVWRWV